MSEKIKNKMNNGENAEKMPILATILKALPNNSDLLMKYRILQIIALFVLLGTMSSCYKNTWARYGHKSHYIHKKKYHSFHKHHNRDW